MEDITDNVETFDGLRSSATEVERTVKVVMEIRVGEILSEVVDRVVEIGIKGQEPPQINLLIAASELCCKARSFEHNKPYIFEN